MPANRPPLSEAQRAVADAHKAAQDVLGTDRAPDISGSDLLAILAQNAELRGRVEAIGALPERWRQHVADCRSKPPYQFAQCNVCTAYEDAASTLRAALDSAPNSRTAKDGER